MEPFKKVSGTAAPIIAANVDTDVIMPKQFLKGIDRKGLDKGAFFDLRFTKDGAGNPDFILNQQGFTDAAFLVVGPNFGCGSSREHAVWGLKQLGIRALIGTSFAGIFNDNCQRNGLLTITIDKEDIAMLMDIVSNPDKNQLTVDLENQKIIHEHGVISFNIDELKKHMLIEGCDAIGYTLRYEDTIRSFERNHFIDNPWFKTA